MDRSAHVVPLRDRLDVRQKWLLVGTLLIAMFVTSLNQQIVATAAPRIVADLGAFNLLSWVFTVFMLASTVVMPVVGKLSDTLGRKAFMIGGLGVFVVGSAGCGFAVSMEMLIVSRAIQGVGAGIVIAVLLVIFWDLFSPQEGGRYLPLFIAVSSVAQLSGPTLGGVITDSIGWRWNFFIGMPFAALAMILAALYLPAHQSDGRRPPIDFLGASLLTVSSTALLLAVAWAQGEYGWTGAETLALIAGGVVVGALFMLQEYRHPEAILPFHILRNRDFMLACTILAVSGAAAFGAATYLPTFLQTALGTSATVSGVIMAPQAIGLLFGSFASGQLLSRTGRFRVQLLAGLLLALIGVLLLRSLGSEDARWLAGAYVAVLGFGAGIATTTMTVVTINVVRHEFIGAAIGARQFLQQMSVVFALAIYGVLLTSTYRSSFEAELMPATLAAPQAMALDAFYDPTLALDVDRFASARATVQRLDGGDVLLEETLLAQRGAVADANTTVFTLSAALLLVGGVAAVLMHERPIRSGFEDEP